MNNSKNIKNVRKMSNRGSILLEALISIVILSTSLSLIIQAMTSSLRAARYSANYTEAIIALENEIFDSLSKGFIEPNISEEKKIDNNMGEFVYSIKANRFEGDVEQDNMENADKISKVNYKISWGSGTKEKKIILSTLLFEEKEK